jgi:hypothetical protein
VVAAVSFRTLIFSFVRVALGGLADDADQYGYGNDRDDYENEQRDYGYRQSIFLPARVLRPPGLVFPTASILPYKSALGTHSGMGKD